ncbi:MAG: AMP-binding protein [Nevskia sp.]|nr:AMP-binding protein [Nevskia sp.]
MTPHDEFLQARDFLLRHRDDYQAAYAGFRWPQLARFNWALDYFDAFARGNPQPALVIAADGEPTQRYSFAQLSARSAQVANFLRRHGVKRGDRVLVMLPNVAALWELMLAGIKLGAVLSPATTMLTGADLADRIERGGIAHVVTDAEGAPRFAPFAGTLTRIAVGGAVPGWIDYAEAGAAPAEFSADGPTLAGDPLLLYFTSGTTSKPKMVLHTQRSYPLGHLSTMYWIGLRPGDLHFNISSPGWAKHAWSCLFAPWSAGATVFIFNQPRFDAANTLRAMVEHGVTTLCAPPTAWRALILQDLARFPIKLREVVSAGEPLNPEVIEQVGKAWGLTVREGYGQTESTAMLGCTPGQPVKSGSMGRPLPGYRAVLLDPEGAEAREGEVSIVLAERPAGLMAGYADSAERTRAALGGSHYGTSDVATRDADGYFWFVGRSDDVFKSSDYRISPFELESVLVEHDAVAEAAVVESPDPKKLCVPKAFVILRPGLEPSAEVALSLFRFTRERLAPYKRIRRLEFAELPKTISGKIRRAELRRGEAERVAAGQRGAHEYRDEDFPELRAG